MVKCLGNLKIRYKGMASKKIKQLGEMRIIKQKRSHHTGTVIFLHGSGGSGIELKHWIEFLKKGKFVFPHIKILFPTAPMQPYTPLNGEYSNVWFNRNQVMKDTPECIESVEEVVEELKKIVDSEVASGISKNRIVVGGFSMGGCMSLYLGYKYIRGFAGIFALSSFLNNGSVIYQAIKEQQRESESVTLPPLFFCHGIPDDVVPFKSGEKSFEELRECGVEGIFHTMDASHEITSYELDLLYEWIYKKVPDQ